MPDQVLTAPSTSERTVEEYKSGTKPTWCPGCGDFGVLNAVYNALRGKGNVFDRERDRASRCGRARPGVERGAPSLLRRQRGALDGGEHHAAHRIE